MKRILITLVTCLVAVGFFTYIPVISARAEADMKIIYAKIPDDWENPCVWAWDTDGNGAFESWPGGEMTADDENTGWYYIYISSDMTNVIINANEGSVQTADFSTDGEDAWFIVDGPEDVTMSNEKQTEGEIPEYVPVYKVYAKVDSSWTEPCLWAWSAPDGTNLYANWPGEAMKANTDGFYSMEVPTWVNSIIINGNAGSVQTADISVEAKDVWLVVDAEGNYELNYEKPEASAEDMITVHAKAPSDWLLPSLWAWSAPDGTNVFANWPGEELTEDGDWYVMDVPDWVNSIIINGNLGEVQTADISVDAGKDIWVVVKNADEYELYYDEPAVIESDTTDSQAEAVTEPVGEQIAETDEKAGLSGGAVAGIIGGIAVVAGGTAAAITSSKKNKKAA